MNDLKIMEIENALEKDTVRSASFPKIIDWLRYLLGKVKALEYNLWIAEYEAYKQRKDNTKPQTKHLGDAALPHKPEKKVQVLPGHGKQARDPQPGTTR